MSTRLRTLGIILVVAGLVFAAVGGVAFAKVQEGYGSLEAFSAAQNVTLNYNDEGQLIDRGSTETAQEIMTLLTDDWGYPVVESHFDPDDPVANTATEYMWQMAVVGYHIMHGTQTVVLDSDVEYNGVTYEAGTYDFPVDGRYWTDFDRMHPLEGPARGQAWSGTAHGLFGELGVGTVTASTLQLGMAVAGGFLGMGFLALIAGFGLIWASQGTSETLLITERKETHATA